MQRLKRRPAKPAKQITIRDVPPETYYFIWEQSQTDGRSMNEQIIYILSEARRQAELPGRQAPAPDWERVGRDTWHRTGTIDDQLAGVGRRAAAAIKEHTARVKELPDTPD
jgi:hypothetical protein